MQGGTVTSIRKGNGVHLIEADLARIKCDHAVLLTSTAIAELRKHPAYASTKEKLSYFVDDNRAQVLGHRTNPISPRATTNVLVNNAKASNQNLNITFACKDRAVLNQMQKLG